MTSENFNDTQGQGVVES